jgi:arsenate reductase-like glutaredoxin family protein
MDYKKYKIDVDLMKLLKEQATNKELKKLFKKHGLRLEQDASIHIKHF